MKFNDMVPTKEELRQARCPQNTHDISLLVNKPEGTEFMICGAPVVYNVDGILLCQECLDRMYAVLPEEKLRLERD